VIIGKNGQVSYGWPMFDPAKDGPILQGKKRLELDTSKGKLRLVLDPAMAPQSATQMYRLLKNGAFNETPFCSYQTGFYLQVGEAQTKIGPGSSISSENRRALRRMPVELGGVGKGRVVHSPGALTLSRDPSQSDSAMGSFSILLGNAPHLDGVQTVFGYADTDPATQATLKALTTDFQANTLVIRGVQELK
jgi:cyclophilin family peptidyl-prolyl cis-trans isomerase